MFIGHIAVGLAAKRAAPKTSLGTLAVAVEFTDLLWPIFLLLGWEQVRIVPGVTVVTPLDFVSYPISHSLLADIGWASLFAGLYLILKVVGCSSPGFTGLTATDRPSLLRSFELRGPMRVLWLARFDLLSQVI